MSSNGNYSWGQDDIPTRGEVPCQNCGKKVTVMLPFFGCVFCGDCTRTVGYGVADSEEFKQGVEDVFVEVEEDDED